MVAISRTSVMSRAPRSAIAGGSHRSTSNYEAINAHSPHQQTIAALSGPLQASRAEGFRQCQLSAASGWAAPLSGIMPILSGRKQYRPEGECVRRELPRPPSSTPARLDLERLPPSATRRRPRLLCLERTADASEHISPPIGARRSLRCEHRRDPANSPTHRLSRTAKFRGFADWLRVQNQN